MYLPTWSRMSGLFGRQQAKGPDDIELQPIAPLLGSHTSWKDHIQRSDELSPEELLRAISCAPIDRVLLYFRSRPEGLTQVKVASRQELVGPNEVSVKKPRPRWMILLLSIMNPFNFLLAILAIIAVAHKQNWPTFIIVTMMIVLSCSVRFYQESRASAAVLRLQDSIPRKIRVRRPRDARLRTTEFVEETIDFKALVPGDVIGLKPGDWVPADCRLLETQSLQVLQSSITGESEPRNKDANPSGNVSGKAVFDLENVALMGTSVVAGSATAVVTSTGNRTVLASIPQHLNQKQAKSAFERGLWNVSWVMLGFVAAVAVIVLVIRGRLTGDWEAAALFSLSVAVGMVPEMLPAIVNTNLVRGAFLLRTKGAIVKPLAAVENLGGMSVLCSDKTGTLTKNEISLARAEDCSHDESDMVLRMAFTNASSQTGGNAIDDAILRMEDGRAHDMVLGKRFLEFPFQFETRRTSVVVERKTGEFWLLCKGAFEEVIGLCSQIRRGVRTVVMDSESRGEMFARADHLSDDGYRVLVVASRALVKAQVAEDRALRDDLEKDLVLEGLLAFRDPLRDDSLSAIARLQHLGIEIKILTGDNMRTALSICRSLNINSSGDAEAGSRAVTGRELEQMDEDSFRSAVRHATVLAKLTPAQKGKVVRALKKDGHTVGMLGDGMNDCTALSVADVGMSVESAVNAGRDCADIVLTEKRLNTIVFGVRTGRLIHGNTMKYIKMVAASNFSNVLSILIASAWLPYPPMKPLQLLVQNLLYDFSQMAIPWDRMDESYLARPRSWDFRDLARFIVFVGPTSCAIDMVTFCLSWFFYGVRSADDTAGVAMINAHWFLQGLLSQTLAVHVLRTAKVPILQSRSSPALAFATLSVMAIGLAVPYIPVLAGSSEMSQPAPSFIGFLAAELLVYCILVQLMKMAYLKIFGIWL